MPNTSGRPSSAFPSHRASGAPALTRAAVLLLAALTALPRASAAQPARTVPQPDAIPRELAMALITFNAGAPGGVDIRVGRAPDNIPAELVPPGAEVLGSMTQFDNSVLVLAVPQTPDSAIAVMESKLLAAGWTRPNPAANRGYGQRGFVPAEYSGTMSGMPNVICHGDEFVQLSSTYRTSSGSVLKLSFNRGARYSLCRTPAQTETAVVRSVFEEAPMPTLRAPAGSLMANVGGGISSNGPNVVTASARLTTRLKPGELMTHYDGLMKAAGWTPVGDGAVEFLAARTYQKKDEKDRTWSALLFAAKTPEGLDQDLFLRISRR